MQNQQNQQIHSYSSSFHFLIYYLNLFSAIVLLCIKKFISTFFFATFCKETNHQKKCEMDQKNWWAKIFFSWIRKYLLRKKSKWENFCLPKLFLSFRRIFLFPIAIHALLSTGKVSKFKSKFKCDEVGRKQITLDLNIFCFSIKFRFRKKDIELISWCRPLNEFNTFLCT